MNVKSCNFTDNHATNDGGAIYNNGYDKNPYYNNEGTLTVTDSNFTGNTATAGGAITNYAGVANYGGGYVTLTDNNFTDNSATGGGGAIDNWAVGATDGAGSLNVNGCTFTGNGAKDGGAIYSMGSDTSSSSIDQFGSLTVNNSTFKDNKATDDGGAIYTGDTTTALHFNRIAGNTATYGSAVYNYGSKVNASLNWWGCNTAASVAKQIYNTGNGTVTYGPWIILTITATPGSVYVDGTSTITADLLHDSNGVYENPANGLVPYTGSAGFATTKGTINNSDFFNGEATSTLTNLNTAGVANVSATVDGKIVQTSVTVK